MRATIASVLCRASLLLLLLSASRAMAQQGGHDRARCGTMLLAEAQTHPERLSKDDRELAARFSARPSNQQLSYSKNRHFVLHYDVTGADAVPAVDADGNNRPDYIDSADFWMEYAWEVEIDEYGYVPPPADDGGPGPEIDVYFSNVGGQSLYGFAVPETINNATNTAVGYLVLDNDYIESFYSSRNIEGLRVTSAHEFHHLIQFGSYRYDLSQATLYEATSTWFERQVHPSIPDYEQYVVSLFFSPQDYGMATHNVRDATTGYAHVMYMQLLAEQLGRDVVRGIWERFKEEPNCWRAIDKTLIDRGLNLKTSVEQFSDWCYFSGPRTVDDTTYFDGADTLPPLRVAKFVPWDAAANEVTIEGELFPLGFGLYQAGLPNALGQPRDTVTFVVTNSRTDLPIGGSGIVKEPFTIHLSRSHGADDRPVRNNDDSITYHVTTFGKTFTVVAYRGTFGTVFPAPRITPQPFINDGVNRLLFDLGEGVDPSAVRSITLDIYSMSMTPIAHIEKTTPDVDRQMVGVAWDGRTLQGDLAPSGIYIYQMTLNGGTPALGKVMVIRR